LPVAAVVGKGGNDVSRQIVDMLDAMSYNKRLFNVATDDEVVTTEDIRSLGLTEAKIAIGRGVSSKDERFFAEPSEDQDDELFLALEGYILNHVSPQNRDEARSDSESVADLIGEEMKARGLSEAVRTVLPVLRGAFSFTVMGRGTIAVARDVFGFEPLYWGEDERCIAFASERKALWRIGLRDVACFPPGCVATVDGRTKDVSRVLSLARPRVVDLGLDDAARRLVEALRGIFLRDFRGIGEVALLFSGGVDSSLVAKISCEAGMKVTLYGVAVEGARDVGVIERSASELGCGLRLRILSLEEVEDYLCRTIYAVEEANVMKVGVGLPVYAAMEAASVDGFGCVFSGQGADELFGGYSRYRRIVRDGCERLCDEIWNDVVRMGEVNLQRDGAIAMVNNVDHYLPFLDLKVVDLAMSLPADLKVKGPGDTMRKHVLREAAKTLGLPEFIAYMPKKAIQYSSGSDMAIRKLARREGKRPSEYVRHMFEKVFSEY